MHLGIHRSYFIAKTRFKKKIFAQPHQKTDIKSHLHIRKNEPRYSQQKSPRFSEISQEAEQSIK